MCAQVYALECKCPWRLELLDPPGDAVTAIVRHMWVLGTELRSFMEVVHTLNPVKKILVKLKVKACTHIKQYIV